MRWRRAFRIFHCCTRYQPGYIGKPKLSSCMEISLPSSNGNDSSSYLKCRRNNSQTRLSQIRSPSVPEDLQFPLWGCVDERARENMHCWGKLLVQLLTKSSAKGQVGRVKGGRIASNDDSFLLLVTRKKHFPTPQVACYKFLGLKSNGWRAWATFVVPNLTEN